MTSGKTLNKTKTHPFTIGDDPVVKEWLLLQSNRNKAIRVAINLMVELYGMFDVNEVIPNKKPATGYRPELDMRARAGLLGNANLANIPQPDNNGINNVAGIDSSQLLSMFETFIKEKGNDTINSKNMQAQQINQIEANDYVTTTPTSDVIEKESNDNTKLEEKSDEEVLDKTEQYEESVEDEDEDVDVDIPNWLAKLK